ncbi:MAG TPA: sialidase family protein [Acidobacteriota bacterium]|nr:sialidase family protein [Acidobacteriota bacterium]
MLTAGLLCWLLFVNPGGARDEGKAKGFILSSSPVYIHENGDPYDLENRFGFNHAPSVTTLPDGRLMAAWFSGPYEASVHQVILGSFSSDGGLNWTPARVIQDWPHRSDFDPAFVIDGSRVWLFFSVGRHNRYPFVQNEKKHVGPDSFSTYYRLSNDSGQSWSEARLAAERVFCRSNGIRLSSGELLVPIYRVPSSGGVLKSSDGGNSWQAFGKIATETGGGEPAVAELSDGRIMMILRTRDGFLWRSFSSDRGETWSAPENTGITAAASSHALLRRRNGDLVLAHNDSKPPARTNLTVRVSCDDGQSWGEPLKVAEVMLPREGEEVWGRQVSYPSLTETADGTVVVVWTRIVLSDREQYGDIWSARVKVD